MRRLFSIPTILFAVIISASFAFAADENEGYYSRAEILKSLINPHEQINDEGEILWNKCFICHPSIPDVKKATNIKDVEIRYKKDPMQMCYRCHPQPMHPGGEWVGRAMGTTGAPNHLVKPPPYIIKNQRMSFKESNTVLPLDPLSGKQFCATCHNPHERGLLIGRADTGADSVQRKRTERIVGATVCQYCHRK